jgi:hypothetical protein
MRLLDGQRSFCGMVRSAKIAARAVTQLDFNVRRDGAAFSHLVT